DIIDIFNSDKKEGFRIYNAMKIAKGEVIAFLDDDDEFAKNKLERIYKYFKDNPNLIFYHNNFYMINETGKILHHPRSVGTDEVLKFKSEKEKRYLVYNALSKLRAEENASAMVLRRSLIVNNLSILKKITVALDAFSFLIALIDSGELWVDSKPLSFYRIHSVGQVTNGPLMTFDSFCSHRKKYTEIAVRDTYVLYNIVKCTA
ncbi:cell wall biosynthesis glycosyltransferase, partial [mine drainage metagenome]